MTFTDPEVGAVGLTEDAARNAGITVATASCNGVNNTRLDSRCRQQGNVQTRCRCRQGSHRWRHDRRPHAGEILAGLTVAVVGKVPVQQLIETVWAYPTYHRGFDAVLAELPDNLKSGR